MKLVTYQPTTPVSDVAGRRRRDGEHQPADRGADDRVDQRAAAAPTPSAIETTSMPVSVTCASV